MAKHRAAELAIQLIRSPGEDGVGVFCVTARKKSSFYFFREIPCAIGGRGFILHRLGLGGRYHVRIGEPADCSCECLGYLAHNHCRHIDGLLALAKSDDL